MNKKFIKSDLSRYEWLLQKSALRSYLCYTFNTNDQNLNKNMIFVSQLKTEYSSGLDLAWDRLLFGITLISDWLHSTRLKSSSSHLWSNDFMDQFWPKQKQKLLMMWRKSTLMNGKSTGIISINRRVVSKSRRIDGKTEYPLILWFAVLWDNMGSDFLALMDFEENSVHFYSKYFPKDYFCNNVWNDFQWIFLELRAFWPKLVKKPFICANCGPTHH